MTCLKTIRALAVFMVLLGAVTAMADDPVGDWRYRSPYTVELHWNDQELVVPMGNRFIVRNWTYDRSDQFLPQEFSVDGGAWQSVDRWFHLTTPGEHSIRVRGLAWDVMEGTGEEVRVPFQHETTVIVMGVEAYGSIHDENDDRAPYFSVTHLAGGEDPWDHPLLLVEGFDPSNEKGLREYYEMAPEFMETLRGLGRDIFFLDFEDGGRDMVLNADVLERTIDMIHDESGGHDLTVVGLSMGGVIARYALARAEDQGTPLPVSHFLSVDSPQQGAAIHAGFQNRLKDEGISIPALTSVAARQLLLYSAWNNTHDLHDDFYSELNALNGDGYPHQCINVAASFTPPSLEENPWTGLGQRWARIAYEDVYTGGAVIFSEQNFNIDAGDFTSEAGSLLPTSSTVDRSGRISWHGIAIRWYCNFYPETARPTFIPMRSALDLDENGLSRFDIAIRPQVGEYYFHDQFPTDPAFLGAILDALEIPMPNRIVSGAYDASERHVFLAQHVLSNVDGTGSSHSFSIMDTGAGPAQPSFIAAGRTIRFTATTGHVVRFGEGAELMVLADPELDSGAVMARNPHAVIASGSGRRDASLSMTETPEATTFLEQNVPNPFNPSTTIHFNLARSGPVTLRIYDVRGGLVRELVNSDMPDGRHAIAWDGRDDVGRRTDSGIYVYRLVTTGFSLNRKMILIK